MKNSNKLKIHNIVKLITWIIIFLCVIYLIFNASMLKICSKYIEYRKLQSNIKIEKEANVNYKERLYLLKNNPQYLDKIVKAELDVIEDGEIEYRFEDGNDN